MFKNYEKYNEIIKIQILRKMKIINELFTNYRPIYHFDNSNCAK